MRIVFMGTPDFAERSLAALIEGGFDIAAVFTQPDKPQGRGMKTVFSPVKSLALAHSLPIYQPERLGGGVGAALMSELSPDILVVVAYGKILPEDMLAVPPLGAINVHGSLLPRYRGAAPIQWAVLNGDETTGVSTMYLTREMDAGDLIYTDETAIGEFETSGALFDRLADMGAALLVRTLHDIESGTAPRKAQDHAKASYTKQLDKSICPIDWNRSPREIVKHVCGLLPWPVATAEIGGETLKIFGVAYTASRTDRAPGAIVSAGQGGIELACAGGETILVTELQAPGKKRMSAADYLRGHPLGVG